MEPPSSANSESEKLAVGQSDDPARSVLLNSYLIVSHELTEASGDNFVVCAYSALTGLKYLGTNGSMES